MYRRTNLPKYLYRTLTNKSRIIQKKIVSFVDDDETVLNFVNSKRNGEVVEIEAGKSLNPVDLTGLEIESLEEASFKDLKVAYLLNIILFIKNSIKVSDMYFSLISKMLWFIFALSQVFFITLTMSLMFVPS